MNKPLASLAAMAMAAMLSLPVQAQHRVRKDAVRPSVASRYTVLKGLQPSVSQAKARPATLRGATDKQQLLQAATRAKTAQLASSAKARKSAAGRETGSAATAAREAFRPYAFSVTSLPVQTFRASGEVVDEHGIITAPADGIRQVYSRSGLCYISEDGMQTVEQSGYVHIVTCDDGTVYIRNLLASVPTGAWVKGTRQGNTISVEARQPIEWYDLAGVTFSIAWGYCEESWGSLSFSYYSADPITFTVDDEAGTITLDSPSENHFIGLFWDDDDAFANFGDKSTVWTYASDFEPMETMEITPPSMMQPETWYVRSHTVQDGVRQLTRSTVGVGFSGNVVYLQGLFADFPEAWMKGVISDGVVTFDGLQTQGVKDGVTYYAVGTLRGDLVPFAMTYDSDAKVLASTVGLLANSSNSDVKALTQLTDLTISQADPFAPIEALPYANSLGSQREFEWFTVVNANNDNSTWLLYDEDGTWKASCQYDTENAADDWLISPAFRLQAGKTYSMAIDINASSDAYSERFEVMLGTAPTTEAMTQQVIAPTETSDEQAQTFQNKLITVPATGTYYFGIHAISDADQASLRASNFVVDETVLQAPSAVTGLTAVAHSELHQVVLSFSAPLTDIAGDALNGNVDIVVSRNGEAVTTFSQVAPGTALNYTDTELDGGKYTYTVTTSNSFGRGESATQAVTVTAVFEIPFTGNFAEEDTYDLFTTINANDDASYWENNVYYAYYEYNTDSSADDYLVTPGLRLEAGQRYVISVDAEAAGDYTERLEVVVGQSPEADALTTVVIEPQEIIGSDGRMTYEGTFTCEESGIYYAAVHCISDADMYGLYIFSVSVEQGPALTAPSAPVVTAQAAAQGVKRVDVTVTVPATAIDGSTLTAALDKVELYRDGKLVKEFAVVAPGTTLTYADETIEQSGNYTYQAVAYNASGAGKKSDRVKVFAGTDIPQDVTGLTVADCRTSVRLSWDAVGSEGANGGYVDPTQVTYKIIACEHNTTFIYDTDPVATVTGTTSCELPYDTDEGEQSYQAWVVVASNESGESSISDAPLATLTVGKPYELPLTESFTDGSFHHYCDYVGTPLLYAQSSDGDDTALALTAEQDNSLVAFTSGKIDISQAENPVFVADVAAFGAEDVMVIATKDGDTDNAIVLGTLTDLAEDYQSVTIDLSSLKDARYVMLAFMARIPTATTFDFWTGEMLTTGDALILDNLRLYDQHDHNLAVILSAPATMLAGRSTDVMAQVTNWGETPASGFTVTFKAGDKVISEQTVSDELDPFLSTVVIATVQTSVLDEPGDLTVTATVSYDADEVAADNVAEAVITVQESVAPSPEGLTAEDRQEQGMALSWSAPTGTAQYTEGFENGMAGWTSIDADADSHDWNYSKYGESAESMDTNSGLASVFSESFSNADNKALTPDNWLVSPRVVLDGTFSFYAKGQDADWCEEHFAVFVSTGDPTDPASFTQVSDELVATGTMDEYSVDLSNYAGEMGYVAIRHFNVSDQFVLVVDDVTYTMGGAPDSYNIYYEGRLVGTVAQGETTFTVAADELQYGERTFAVTAVYGNGLESRPATAVITVTVDIQQAVTDGQTADVYTVDGRLVRRQATTLEGLKGLYVVGGKTVIVK